MSGGYLFCDLLDLDRIHIWIVVPAYQENLILSKDVYFEK